MNSWWLIDLMVMLSWRCGWVEFRTSMYNWNDRDLFCAFLSTPLHAIVSLVWFVELFWPESSQKFGMVCKAYSFGRRQMMFLRKPIKEWTWIELNWIELNWIELNWIVTCLWEFHLWIIPIFREKLGWSFWNVHLYWWCIWDDLVDMNSNLTLAKDLD